MFACRTMRTPDEELGRRVLSRLQRLNLRGDKQIVIHRKTMSHMSLNTYQS
jgi:hypothetical protein